MLKDTRLHVRILFFEVEAGILKIHKIIWIWIICYWPAKNLYEWMCIATELKVKQIMYIPMFANGDRENSQLKNVITNKITKHVIRE